VYGVEKKSDVVREGEDVSGMGRRRSLEMMTGSALFMALKVSRTVEGLLFH
jgi:hypothetical protein